MRMPFQRLYIVYHVDLIRVIQSAAKLTTYVPNLLEFGVLFSGVNSDSRKLIREMFAAHGNGFTMSVHKFLTRGMTLQAVTRTAIEKLAASVSTSFPSNAVSEVQLLETIRHDLMLALTGAIYGPENPYDNPDIEASWLEFVPGISHLLYSPFPSITARKALRARARIHTAFADYFATGGHHQAFPMISEMFDRNRNLGLTLPEAAKMEMATSLAMLSSGAITAFWLLFHICSDAKALQQCRSELSALVTSTAGEDGHSINVVDVSAIKKQCPTLMAMLQETLRYHSTLINIKKVAHDTTLASKTSSYLLKKDAIVMIPGTAVHHDTDIWGPTSTTFDHRRFTTAVAQKNLSSTLAYRPFGAGATMCPGRHFSTNVILALAAMVLLQFEVMPVEGEWTMPTTKGADMWNAMPKPDADVSVRVTPRTETQGVEWKFIWDGNSKDADEHAGEKGA
jgi:cytochrome P450